MLGQADRIEVEAPAKINLYLAVLARRSNGYHDIQSVVCPVALFDRVTLERSDGAIETIVETADDGLAPHLPPSDENLTTRAAKLLKQSTGYRGGAVIRLRKHIPIGGGLGGGSSDAAAVLNGLNRLWRTGATRAELMEIGSGVGCDVPAFVHGGAVLIEGMGEKVSPLAVANPRVGAAQGAAAEENDRNQAGEAGWWLVIVNPGFGVSTRDIYSRHQLSLTPGRLTAMDIVSPLKNGEFDLVAKGLFNSLQETAFRKYPLLAIIRETLLQAGAAGALLSGSGASVFGLARSSRHAQQIAAATSQTLGDSMWVRVSRILPDGVMAAHGPLEA
jgi:4-diphosphocytidyl-2-C-methyl-D-erythritol kinase